MGDLKDPPQSRSHPIGPHCPQWPLIVPSRKSGLINHLIAGLGNGLAISRLCSYELCQFCPLPGCKRVYRRKPWFPDASFSWGFCTNFRALSCICELSHKALTTVWVWWCASTILDKLRSSCPASIFPADSGFVFLNVGQMLQQHAVARSQM